MPLTLYVDHARWRDHLASVLAAEPDLVPVAKGNGYGFTVAGLARTAADLGVDCLAVGTVEDAATALPLFSGDLLVLGNPDDAYTDICGHTPMSADLRDRVVFTVESLAAAQRLAGRRIVVDCRTSLRRQGVDTSELGELRHVLGPRTVEGFTLHLPIDRPHRSDPREETTAWMRALIKAGFDVPTMYVSHLDALETAALTSEFPGTRFRPRVGTRLWLGDKQALRAAATVHQLIPVRRGERLGYRQERCAHDGWLVVVSGGTAHGVGLEAPKTLRGVRPRIRSMARSG
ncbi:MAG: alanine racemase, partial [Actinocrinis sp.]